MHIHGEQMNSMLSSLRFNSARHNQKSLSRSASSFDKSLNANSSFCPLNQRSRIPASVSISIKPISIHLQAETFLLEAAFEMPSPMIATLPSLLVIG